MSAGSVVSIKDLVVKVEFADDMPEIGEVVVVDDAKKSQLLVDSLPNDTTALCLNIRSSRSIQKAMKVERTHKSIEVPIGPLTIGRIFDAVGEPLDGKPQVPDDTPRKGIFTLGEKKQRLYGAKTRTA